MRLIQDFLRTKYVADRVNSNPRSKMWPPFFQGSNYLIIFSLGKCSVRLVTKGLVQKSVCPKEQQHVVDIGGLAWCLSAGKATTEEICE